MLERRLPPRVFELTRDLLLGNVSHREVEKKRLEAEGGQLTAQARAFHEVFEHLGLRGQSSKGTHEGLHRKRRQRLRP